LFCTETHGKCFYFGAKTECSLSRALSSIKQRNDVSGVRVRLFDKGSGFFSGDKFCGQVVVRLNLANLRAPESASMPLQKRLGHPKDVVSGAIEFAIAFEDTASKTTTKNTTTSTSTSTGSSSLRAIELDNDEDDDDESTTRKDNDDDDDDDDDKTDDIVADDSKPNEFADLIFGGHTPVVTAAVAAVAAAKEAAVASSPASERRAVTAVAPAVTGEQLKDSILFNDVAIEEALCGASFVIVPKDDECDSVRDGPAAVELQPLGVASSHGKRGKARSERATLRTSAGHKLVLAGDGAVCSNVRLLADRWYFEVTVLSVGARLRDSASGNAHCRVGVCVSSTDRAVFVDGAAVGESALASSVCAGEVDDAACAAATSDAEQQWNVGDVLSVLVDVDAALVRCWRHSRASLERATAQHGGRPPKLASSTGSRLLHLGNTNGGVRAYGAVGEGWNVEFNFGSSPFALRPLPGVRTMYSRLADAQVGEAHALFDRLAGSATDEALITGDGVAALQSELAAQSSEAKRHEDVLLLVLAWRCHATTLWTLTRDEFVLMCMHYGVSTLTAIAALLASDANALLGDMSGADDAVELYNFAFEYLRDDKKVLLVEEACVAWELLLKPKQWALFDEWLAFVRSGAHKAVARDPWQQVVPFARRYATREVAIATYDAENSAFNVLFDEFVEFLARDEKGSQRQN
jgi:hypothetical protein